MINQKVKLKSSYAKWHLDHPEIYEINGKMDELYETDILIHLVCCLGEPVYGRIIKASRTMNKCWLVKWKIGNLSTQYYVERHHFNTSKLYNLVEEK